MELMTVVPYVKLETFRQYHTGMRHKYCLLVYYHKVYDINMFILHQMKAFQTRPFVVC